MYRIVFKFQRDYTVEYADPDVPRSARRPDREAPSGIGAVGAYRVGPFRRGLTQNTATCAFFEGSRSFGRGLYGGHARLRKLILRII